MKHRKNRFGFKMMCFILVACLVIPSAGAFASADAEPLKITVAADTHFQCASDLGEPSDEYTEFMLDSETFGYASTQGQMNYESEAILAEMLSRFAASDSEYLLIAGDLTCGKRQSHYDFAEHLRKTELESGKQIFVINGNHDCDAQSSDKGISIEEFREIYAQFGYNEALSRHDTSASYTADLGTAYRLMAVDSCIYGEDDGEINSSVFTWISEQAEKAKTDGKELIVMMHHSLLPHYELQPMIKRWQYYAGWFADHGVKTVLTGHIHANDISSSVSDGGNTIYDIQTGALISSPNTYRELEFNAESVKINSRFISKIDTSLLPEYLSDAQKEMLSEDFTGYAKEYFTGGVCKWVNRNIGSVNRIARWFNLKEGTKAYSAAEHLMKKLGAAVGQDIYRGESGRSIEETLALYHISVPESEYRKPYQVAAKLMYGFFHGDEDAAGNERDIKLLLTCLEGAILTAILDGFDAASLASLIQAVSGKNVNITSFKNSVLIRETAENIALALVQTLAGGFIDDYSAPEDLNVTLTTETADNTAPLHFLIRVLNIISEFLKRLMNT